MYDGIICDLFMRFLAISCNLVLSRSQNARLFHSTGIFPSEFSLTVNVLGTKFRFILEFWVKALTCSVAGVHWIKTVNKR